MYKNPWKKQVKCLFLFLFFTRFRQEGEQWKDNWRFWFNSWCWPTDPSVAHQPARCPWIGHSPWAAALDPVLPVLPELPPWSVNSSRAWTEGCAPAAFVEVHSVFRQHHCGSVFTEPALPQHSFRGCPLQTSVPQAEVGSSAVHCRCTVASGTFP